MNHPKFLRKWRSCNLFFCMLMAYMAGNAQTMTMDVMPNARVGEPAIAIYGGSNLDNSIPYEKIKGSPYWSDEYQLAALYSENDREKWVMQTKLNLTTGEIYFITKNGDELVAPKDLVKKVVFFQNRDTTKPYALFRYDYGEKYVINNLKDYYVQVMNEGNFQLLKYNQRPLASADSFHIAKRYFFKDDIKFYIQNGTKTRLLKKLSKDYVLEQLPGSAAMTDWIDANKINFKKEEDVVRFLDYYNSKK